MTGCRGPRAEHGRRLTEIGDVEVPAEGVTVRGLRMLMARVELLERGLSRQRFRMTDVKLLREWSEALREARALEAEIGVGREAGTCGFGHRHCPYAGSPELEARLLVHAAIRRDYPRLMFRSGEAIAASLLADDALREDVMHRVAKGRAAREREQVDDDVPEVITFDDDGRPVPVVPGDDGDEEAL